MRKSMIVFIAVITLMTFGTVSSSYALIDPVSLSIILAAGFTTIITGTELVREDKSKKVDDKTSDQVTEAEIKPAAVLQSGGLSPD